RSLAVCRQGCAASRLQDHGRNRLMNYDPSVITVASGARSVFNLRGRAVRPSRLGARYRFTSEGASRLPFEAQVAQKNTEREKTMTPITLCRIGAVAALASISATLTGAAQAQTIELKFADRLPQDHYIARYATQ